MKGASRICLYRRYAENRPSQGERSDGKQCRPGRPKWHNLVHAYCSDRSAVQGKGRGDQRLICLTYDYKSATTRNSSQRMQIAGNTDRELGGYSPRLPVSTGFLESSWVR